MIPLPNKLLALLSKRVFLTFKFCLNHWDMPLEEMGNSWVPCKRYIIPCRALTNNIPAGVFIVAHLWMLPAELPLSVSNINLGGIAKKSPVPIKLTTSSVMRSCMFWGRCHNPSSVCTNKLFPCLNKSVITPCCPSISL